MRSILAAVLFTACKSFTQPDAAGTAATAEPLPSVAPSRAVAAAPGVALSVVYQGVCPFEQMGHVGPTPLLLHRAPDEAPAMGTLYALTDGLPRQVKSFPYGGTGVSQVGGTDVKHIWIETDAVLRGEETYREIQHPDGYGAPTDKPRHVIEQPDGSIWIGREDTGYEAISSSVRRSMPGKDMYYATRLSSGELVVAGSTKKGEAVLRRWSPTKKVGDLVVPGTTGRSAVEVGGKLVLLATPDSRPAFRFYDGTALRDSKLEFKPVSWLMTRDDVLLATDDAGQIWTEHPDGRIEHQQLPEPAKLDGSAASPWLRTPADSFYARVGGAWVPLSLPPGPWTSPQAGPRHVKRVYEEGEETLIEVGQLEPRGDTAPVETVILYSSKPRARAFRCGAPFALFGHLPPRADATCTDRIVLVGPVAKTYSAVASALRGQAGVPPTLDLVELRSNVAALRAPTAEAASLIEKALAKLQPEVLCGAPDVKRTLHLDVATGAFGK